jgi:methyl-accepting chemotaxis protein
LIETTITKVKGGSELLGKTADSFSQVVKSTSQVKNLIQEINAASQEQTQGVDQINQAVAEMDKVVQQNAAAAEEGASASEELTAQSHYLNLMVRELEAIAGKAAQHSPETELLVDSRTHKEALAAPPEPLQIEEFKDKET